MKLGARSSLSTVALVVGDALRRRGIRAVLTGGACANLYSGGRYQSVDIDFIVSGTVSQRAMDEAMGSVEFVRKGDRYVHPAARFYVEFPRGPLAIGDDYAIRAVEHASRRCKTLALSATDSCRDRLAAFYHWNDRQSLRVAVWIACRSRVSLATIRAWSRNEGFEAAFAEFAAELGRARRKRG